MSKSIFIIDTPEKCCDCMFHYMTFDENDCYVDKCRALNDETIDGYIEKYDECPLKKLPEKKKETYQLNRRDSRGYFETYGEAVDNIAIGYNQCIDDILRN